MVKKQEIYIQRFTEWMQVKGWSIRTLADYESSVRHFFDYLDQETSISALQEIDARTVHGYQNYLYHVTGKQGKHLVLATQHKKLVAVRSFFRFLQNIDVLLFNPADSLQLPKKRKKLPKGILSEEQMTRLLEQPDTSTPLGFRDRTIMEVIYATAIRNSELRNLAIYDVDLDQMRLIVRQGKNAKDRIVPLGEIACDYVHEYLVTVRPKLKPAPEQQLLFVSKHGLQITQANLVWIIQKYTNRLDNFPKHIGPHSFRHSCATHMLRHGADIRYIQTLLGHASIATTQIYTKVEDVDLKAVHRQCHPRELVHHD